MCLKNTRLIKTYQIQEINSFLNRDRKAENTTWYLLPSSIQCKQFRDVHEQAQQPRSMKINCISQTPLIRPHLEDTYMCTRFHPNIIASQALGIDYQIPETKNMSCLFKEILNSPTSSETPNIHFVVRPPEENNLRAEKKHQGLKKNIKGSIKIIKGRNKISKGRKEIDKGE